MTGADQLQDAYTAPKEKNTGARWINEQGEYDMNKMKSKEFLYPIDRDRLMGDPILLRAFFPMSVL